MTDRSNTDKPTVIITKAADYQCQNIARAVQKQLTLLNAGDLIKTGDSVLLKPNFIAPKDSASAAVTDPAVILEVAKAVIDLGARPFVADSPAWSDMAKCVRVLELEEPLKKLGVPFKQLNKPKRCRIAGSSIGISTVAMEADRIINLPKLKSHQQVVATIAIKNMFGCVPGKEKPFWHFAKGANRHNFCRMLIEIYKYVKPVFTIVDGVLAMEGAGPINGTPRTLGFLAGSLDPIACEAACCKLIDLDPKELPIIQTAEAIGFGCADISKIDIIGDDYTELICKDFDIPELVPLRFSLPRICKSIAKQFALTAGSFLSRKKNSSH